MLKNYKLKIKIKKAVTFLITLFICGSLSMIFSEKKTEAATANKEIVFETTAYAAGTMTASGRTSVRNPIGISTVAVDPTVIPYGTYLYIEGYGYAVAADTGSSIKGYRLDLFFYSYSEACDWGRQNVNVIILSNSTNL